MLSKLGQQLHHNNLAALEAQRGLVFDSLLHRDGVWPEDYRDMLRPDQLKTLGFYDRLRAFGAEYGQEEVVINALNAIRGAA